MGVAALVLADVKAKGLLDNGLTGRFERSKAFRALQ